MAGIFGCRGGVGHGLMTLADVQLRLSEIKACAGDPEAAHGMEDDLWLDVLDGIARGLVANPAEVCAMALRSRNIDFQRRCA